MPTKEMTDSVVRSDAEIARDVKRGMKVDLEVPDDRIRIKVTDGLVTIEGTVAREAQRDAAGNCAKRVKGVIGVANKITLEPDAPPIES